MASIVVSTATTSSIVNLVKVCLVYVGTESFEIFIRTALTKPFSLVIVSASSSSGATNVELNWLEKTEAFAFSQNSSIDKFKFSKILFLLTALYGLFYASISIGQTNSKLFMQYDMSNFLNKERIAIYLSIILALSRLSRTVSNLVFMKVYKKLKNNIVKLLQATLLSAFTLMLIGHFVGNGMLGIIIMVLFY